MHARFRETVSTCGAPSAICSPRNMESKSWKSLFERLLPYPLDFVSFSLFVDIWNVMGAVAGVQAVFAPIPFQAFFHIDDHCPAPADERGFLGYFSLGERFVARLPGGNQRRTECGHLDELSSVNNHQS